MIVLGNLLFLHRFFGPWLRRTLHESKRVAELLAQLPKELSVETMLMEAMGIEGVRRTFFSANCSTQPATQ